MLQHVLPPHHSPDEFINQTTCNGYDVRFWRDEREIASLAESGMLNHNNESIGKLLRGFFEYYAHTGQLSTGGGQGFNWTQEVLSLRTERGIILKREKGWTAARTEMETRTEATPTSATTPNPPSYEKVDKASPTISIDPTPQLGKKEEVKEIRHRYLVAIEDPFEITHNVGRTVNFDGIVAIRNEFRRAWQILMDTGKGVVPKAGGLLDEVVPGAEAKGEFEEVMNMIHGKA
jgi:hypothetical protein